MKSFFPSLFLLAAFASFVSAIENYYEITTPNIDGIQRGQPVRLSVNLTAEGRKKKINYPTFRLEIVGLLEVSGKVFDQTVPFETRADGFTKELGGDFVAIVSNDLHPKTRKLRFCIRDVIPTKLQKFGFSPTSSIKGCSTRNYHVIEGQFRGAEGLLRGVAAAPTPVLPVNPVPVPAAQAQAAPVVEPRVSEEASLASFPDVSASFLPLNVDAEPVESHQPDNVVAGPSSQNAETPAANDERSLDDEAGPSSKNTGKPQTRHVAFTLPDETGPEPPLPVKNLDLMKNPKKSALVNRTPGPVNPDYKIVDRDDIPVDQEEPLAYTQMRTYAAIKRKEATRNRWAAYAIDSDDSGSDGDADDEQ